MPRYLRGKVAFYRQDALDGIGQNFVRLGQWAIFLAMAHRFSGSVDWKGEPKKLNPGDFVAGYRELQRRYGIPASSARRYAHFLQAAGVLDIIATGDGGDDGIIASIAGWKENYAEEKLKTDWFFLPRRSVLSELTHPNARGLFIWLLAQANFKDQDEKSGKLPGFISGLLRGQVRSAITYDDVEAGLSKRNGGSKRQLAEEAIEWLRNKKLVRVEHENRNPDKFHVAIENPEEYLPESDGEQSASNRTPSDTQRVLLRQPPALQAKTKRSSDGAILEKGDGRTHEREIGDGEKGEKTAQEAAHAAASLTGSLSKSPQAPVGGTPTPPAGEGSDSGRHELLQKFCRIFANGTYRVENADTVGRILSQGDVRSLETIAASPTLSNAARQQGLEEVEKALHIFRDVKNTEIVFSTYAPTVVGMNPTRR